MNQLINIPKEDLIQIEREACKDSFYEFILSFWSVVSKEEFVRNWHIPFLCEELQYLSTFIIKRLPKPYDAIINIPPGTTKSTITTIMWPVWLWVKDLTIKVISNGHSAALSLEHATKSRDIIESDKFRLLYPHIKIRADKGAKGFYENTKGGVRVATSTGSSSTGMHFHLILNDDPSDPKKVFSEAIREQVVEKLKELSTRKINKLNTITVTIMQRLHEEDATGYILENYSNIKHICLPAEISEYVKPAHLKTKYINGLLDPIRQSKEVLETAKVELGSAAYSGQYDQMPTAKGGNIIKNEWFQYCTFSHYMSRKGHNPVIFFGDTAYTEKKKNDPSGFIATSKIDNLLYIIDATSVRKKFPDLIRFLPRYLQQHFYGRGSSLRIEPKASGISTIDELKDKTSINVMKTPEPIGSKEERLNMVSPTVEAVRVILVEGPWNESFVDQVCGFPNKRHDEYVDLLCYAIDYHLPHKSFNHSETYAKLKKALS